MRVLHARVLGGTAVAAGVLAVTAWALTQPPKADPMNFPKDGEFRPRWAVGDSWVVETTSQPVNVRVGGWSASGKPIPAPPPIKAEWKFTVAADAEKIGAAECYRIDVSVHPNARSQPVTRLWLDNRSLALKQIQAQLPVGGGYATVTESYDSGNGPAAPVTGLLTAIPVDVPVFPSGKARPAAKQAFVFEAVSGPAAAKRDLSDVAFATPIEQSVTPVEPKERGLVPPALARNVNNPPLFKVELKTPERSVTQIWQVGQPWPVYAKNGPTEARLILFAPAKK